MPTFDFVSGEEHRALQREVTALRALVEAHVTGQPEWLPTAAALKAAGIPHRETLVQYARAKEPFAEEKGRITYKKEGKRCLYLKSSCTDYALRKLGQPTLRP